MRAMNCVTLISWEGLMKYWYKMVSVHFDPKLNTVGKRFGYRCIHFFLQTLCKYDIFHWIIGKLFRSNIISADSNRFKIYKDLDERYKHIKMTEVIKHCPFSPQFSTIIRNKGY